MTEEKPRHVAFYQVSLMKDELGTPTMEGFEELNAELNHIADSYPGIVYRFRDPDNALHHRLYAPEYPLIVSQLIVAVSAGALTEFGNSGLHKKAKTVDSMRYFDKEGLRRLFPNNMVLWYVNQRETPDLKTGKAKLNKLIQTGPSEEAFTFREALSEIRNGG